MGKKLHYKESKEQKEKKVLFDHMEKEISKVKEYLKNLYSMAGSPNVGLLVSEEFIHRRVAALDRVKSLIWDLLVDEMAPKKILDELKNNKVSPNP